MVRNYKRKTEDRWSKEDLLEALTKIKESKLKINDAARQYRISRATLYRQFKKFLLAGGKCDVNQFRTCGGNSILTEVEEDVLEKTIRDLREQGFTVTAIDIKRICFEYCESNGTPNKFNPEKRMASEDWYYGFLKRKPAVRIGKLRNTSASGRSDASSCGKKAELVELIVKTKKKNKGGDSSSPTKSPAKRGGAGGKSPTKRTYPGRRQPSRKKQRLVAAEKVMIQHEHGTLDLLENENNEMEEDDELEDGDVQEPMEEIAEEGSEDDEELNGEDTPVTSGNLETDGSSEAEDDDEDEEDEDDISKDEENQTEVESGNENPESQQHGDIEDGDHEEEDEDAEDENEGD